MKRFIRSSIAICILGVVTSAQCAFAANTRFDSGDRPSNTPIQEVLISQGAVEGTVVITEEALIQKLELTEEQQMELMSTFELYQPEIEESFSRFQASLVELNAVLMPTSSEAEIRIARQNAISSGEELRELLFNRLMEVRAILTVEQREKVHELIQELADSLVD